MNANLEELLALYAMGMLETQEEAEVVAHLEANPEAVHTLDDLVESFHAFADEAPQLKAPTSILDGVLEASHEVSRFDSLASTVASLIDHTLERTRALLASIDEASSWVAGPSPESSLVHFDGGPALAGVLVGFIRLRAGARFPEHKHLGKEIVYVLQGAFMDDDGTVVRRGESRQMEEGTAHDFEALEGPDLIYLVVLDGGVEFDFPFEI